MTASSSPTSSAQPRWKVALVPVLAMILAWVAWPSADSTESEQLTALRSPAEKSLTRTPEDSVAARVRLNPVPQWDLSRALAYDPLSSPAFLNPVKVAVPLDAAEIADSFEIQANATQQELANHLERLQNLKVDAILVSDSRPVALIGDRTLRIGDHLAEGATIVRIDRGGITLRVDRSPVGADLAVISSKPLSPRK